MVAQTDGQVGALVFMLGAVIGSFLNVVVYRMPRGKSVVLPRSRCPACGVGIPPLLNVPILSYLVLRGRCQKCQTGIPWTYPLVELLAGVSAWMLFREFGLNIIFLKYLVLVYFLIVISGIDISHKLILNRLSVPGILLGLGFALAGGDVSPFRSVIGLLVGGGSLVAVALMGSLLFRKESLGGGDVKLAAMIGAFVGPEPVLLGLFIAFVLAGSFSAVGMVAGRLGVDDRIPFGPFIAVGEIMSFAWGAALWNAYVQLVT